MTVVDAGDVVREAYRGALPSVLLSAAGGLAAGTMLGGMEGDLRAVPGLLVVVPAFLAIRGSVYGSLGSRLSSALHQGLVDPDFSFDRRVRNAVVAAIGNGVTASVFAALLTVGALRALGQPVAPPWLLVGIAAIGGVLAGLALTAVVLVVVFVGYRRGLNPDDVVGPAVTTAGDLFGMAALVLATRLLLGLQ